MVNLALLALRVTTGSLLAGHGAQKLFGSFGGPGLERAGETFEKMGLRPGHWWAPVAGLTEFSGGVLTLLGLLHPLGPLAILGAMTVATLTAHRGKPIWASAGGADLPVTNMAIATALIVAGPGRCSLDALLGTRLSVSSSMRATLAGAGIAAAATTGAVETLAKRMEVA